MTRRIATRMIDQQAVDTYAQVSGDDNPLHVDPDFARTTPFGSTIAHGLLVLSLIGQEIEAALGPDVPLDELEAAFVGPVPVGAQVHISIELVANGVDGKFRCSTSDHDAVVGSFTGRQG